MSRAARQGVCAKLSLQPCRRKAVSCCKFQPAIQLKLPSCFHLPNVQVLEEVDAMS